MGPFLLLSLSSLLCCADSLGYPRLVFWIAPTSFICLDLSRPALRGPPCFPTRDIFWISPALLVLPAHPSAVLWRSCARQQFGKLFPAILGVAPRCARPLA